jgi:hypothetical protein
MDADSAADSDREEDEQPSGLDAAAAQAIAACDGDLAATIRALVVANDFLLEHNAALAQELDYAWRWISPGFTRSKLRRQVKMREPE